MALYRNLTAETRWVVAADGGMARVEPDGVVDLDDVATQPPASQWAPVTTTKKAAPAAKE